MDHAPRWIASRVEEALSDTAVAVYLTGGACGSTDTANPDLPKCVTDDAGNSTAMRYDALGNLLSRADTTCGTSTGSRIEYTYQRRVGALTMSPLIATAAATVGVYAGIVGVASTVSCHSSIRNERFAMLRPDLSPFRFAFAAI